MTWYPLGGAGVHCRSIKLTQTMSLIYSEWLAILLFIVVSIGLSGVLFGLSYAFIHQNPDLEKTSAYECGFNPFEDSRLEFDIKFYVIAILFLIFYLEVSFLFLFIYFAALIAITQLLNCFFFSLHHSILKLWTFSYFFCMGLIIYSSK